MKPLQRLGLLGSVVLASLATPAPAQAGFIAPHMVVANRGSASISVIDVETSVVTTFPLPAGSLTSQPMYVAYSPANDLVFVGDRNNNRVVAFNARTYDVVANNIAAGAGVFHMFGGAARNQLWVNNDIDRTISVIDMLTFGTLATIPTPNDLGPNAIPHDVILDPNGGAAYVTIIGASGPNDFVVKYSADTFTELGRQAVGKDPHVTLTAENNLLYVASQNGDRVEFLDRATLAPVAPPLPLFHAHGVAVTQDGQSFYVTSFPGIAPNVGLNGLHVIDTLTNSLLNSVSAPNIGAGPHNIGLSPDNSRLYITHTGGTSTTVSIFDISGANETDPAFLATVTVGTNPFGIAAVSAATPEPGTLALLLVGGAPLMAWRLWRLRNHRRR